MKNFDDYFRNPRPFLRKKEEVIKSMRRHYDSYSRRNISISECLPATGGLTADLTIYRNIEVDITKTAYDTIQVVAINYYAMLYMDLFSDYYAVNEKHAYQQVYTLVKDVLEKSTETKALAIDDIEEALHSSRDISKQAVDIYYRAGAEGCKKHLTVSIYAILLTGNRYHSVKCGQIDKIVRDLYAKKILDGSFSTIYSGS